MVFLHALQLVEGDVIPPTPVHHALQAIFLTLWLCLPESQSHGTECVIDVAISSAAPHALQECFSKTASCD